MNKKVFLILVGIFLTLAVIAAGFFAFNNFLFKTKDLTAYLPQNTLAYFEFQPNNKQLLELYENNFRAKTRLSQMIYHAGLWGDFNRQLIEDKINKIAIVVLDVRDSENHLENQFKYAWLIEAKDTNELNVLLPKNYLAANLDKKVVVVTKDYETLNVFRSQKNLSFSNENRRVIFSKFNHRKFLNSYLSNSYLKHLLVKPYDFNQLILNNLNLDEKTPAYFSLRADNDSLIFNFQAASKINKTTTLLSDDYSILKQLSLEHLFSAVGIPNLNDVIKKLEENNEYLKNKEFLSIKYNFNWQDFYDLATNQAVLFFKYKVERPGFEELLSRNDLEYGILIKAANPKQAENFYLELKKFLSAYLSFLYPTIEVKELPDKTQINILSAQSSSILWQAENGVEFFENQGTKVALARENDIIYLSPSKELLLEIMSQDKENKKLDRCPNFSGQEIVYYNTKKLSAGLLSFVDDFLMVIDQQDGGVSLKGCFIY